MSSTYTGNPAGGARTPAVAIQQPSDGDGLNAASVNVGRATLADYVAWLQAHAAIADDDNTFTGNVQAFNPAFYTVFASAVLTQLGAFMGNTAGDSSAVIEADDGASADLARKLILAMNCNPSGATVARLYVWRNAAGASGALELVVGASYDGALWHADNASCRPIRMGLYATPSGYQWQFYNQAAASPDWAEGAWLHGMFIDPTVIDSIDSEGISGTGIITSLVDVGGTDTSGGGEIFIAPVTFRKRFPSTPSLGAFTVDSPSGANPLNNAGPVSVFRSRYGVEAEIVATIGGLCRWFGHVTFS